MSDERPDHEHPDHGDPAEHDHHAGKADLPHETTVETDGHFASGTEAALEVDHEKRIDGHVVEHEHYITGEGGAGEAPPSDDSDRDDGVTDRDLPAR